MSKRLRVDEIDDKDGDKNLPDLVKEHSITIKAMEDKIKEMEDNDDSSEESIPKLPETIVHIRIHRYLMNAERAVRKGDGIRALHEIGEICKIDEFQPHVEFETVTHPMLGRADISKEESDNWFAMCSRSHTGIPLCPFGWPH